MLDTKRRSAPLPVSRLQRSPPRLTHLSCRNTHIKAQATKNQLELGGHAHKCARCALGPGKQRPYTLRRGAIIFGATL